MQALLKQQRKSYLDLARIIGALAVVMVHVSADFVVYSPKGTLGYTAGCIFDAVSRIGVTFFVMISGVLMLDEGKELPAKKCLRYILGILTLFLAWSFIYAVVYGAVIPVVKGGEAVTGKEFFKTLIFGHYHMWYLLMIMGLYAVTPVIRLIAKKQNANKVLFFILLCVFAQGLKLFYSYLCQFYPQLTEWNAFINKFHADYLFGYIAYYLAGWYIVNIGFSKKRRIALYGLGGLGISVTILITQVPPFSYGIAFADSSIFNFFYHIALFDIVVHFYKGGEKRNALVYEGSKLTFGVYMTHILLLTLYDELLAFSFNPFFYIPFKWFIVSAGSFGISYLLSKIPYLKKLARG